MAQPDLAYIALSSRVTDQTEAFLGDDLGLPAFTVTAPDGCKVTGYGVGQTALLVFPQGHAFLESGRPGVDHIAIAATDPAAARDATGLPAAELAATGLLAKPQAGLDRSATAGVSVRYAPALSLPAVQRGPVSRIDHIGIASADNAAAETVFCGRIGAVYESRQTDMEVATAMESFTSDKYGAVYHARKPQTVGGLRVSFLTIGDLELEFLQDFDPGRGFEISHGAAGTTKQDQSAIGRFVEKHGGGLHHVALKVDDINLVLSRLAERGNQLIDTVGRPGSRRALIGFVHPSSTGGVLFHFVQRDELASSP
ncbi:MAG: VOC family protein [Alphaproteobacteria bacterium]|nr:VOC family protein [Alphaproteobacteria bacterium]